MLTTLRGIILRTVKYSESSVICDIFTREQGLRTYIMGGVRQAKAKIPYALVRPMNWVEIVAYHREDRDINRVKELKPELIYSKIPFDLIRGALGLFMTELVQKTVKETGNNEELYEFLHISFELLDSLEGNLSNFHLSFMSKLAVHLGFMPDLTVVDHEAENLFFDYQEGTFTEEKPVHAYYLHPQQSAFLFFFLEHSLFESSGLKLNVQQRQLFIEELLKFYRYHFDQLHINSHEILHQVLS